MDMSTISRAVKIGLHAYGIWPYLPSTILFRLLCIVMFGTVQFFQYQYVVIHFYIDNFSDLMDGVSSAMTYSLFIIKLIILWANQQTFSDILQMMAMDWRNCVLTDRSLRITTNKAKLSHRISSWIIGLQIGAIILYTCGVLSINTGNIQRMNVSAREHILKLKLPFQIDTVPIYMLVTILEFLNLAMCGYGTSMINSFIITLSMDAPNGVVILVKSVLYYIVINLEAFVYCFVGEYLNVKSKMIGDAAYDSLWYDITTKKKRIILLVILRSQKRLTITIGKIMDLSLDRFASILHIGGQIDILCEWLLKGFSKNMTHTVNGITVKALITKHQQIIMFSENIENLYTYIALMLFVSDTIIICCLGFIIITSKMIGDAAYDSLWYDITTEKKRIILLVILRSQKRLTITIGKIMDLSLERFASVRFLRHKL
ncbi:PREDICTED: uncharacterized protein LOC108778727 [Cyphomyrmex costatus]|uniref:uncharacterized protein LOC108778727 n=1 Tax=Cyphomyrmex costatus TaxID=456900 RepID=UPI000852459F|nr:PREDICTED: uncharacterized protein LOC108778727 [Cyphomyrmex costatus]